MRVVLGVLTLLVVLLTATGINSQLSEHTWLRLAVTGGNYTPNQTVTGTLYLIHDDLLLNTSTLRSYIDGELISSISAAPYIHDKSFYTYKPQSFSYKVVGSGENVYKTYTDEVFTFSVTKIGSCSLQVCADATNSFDQSCGTSPCTWSHTIVLDQDTYTVNGKPVTGDGMKLILDAAQLFIAVPGAEGVSYTATTTANPFVILETREACGNEPFQTYSVNHTGWIPIQIFPESWQQIPPTGRRGNIGFSYDESSLGFNRNKFFNDIPGGIYRNGVYQQPGVDVNLFGDEGIIEIILYTGGTYTMVFMPPAGSRVCAYTESADQTTEPWSAESSAFTGSVAYQDIYENNIIQLPQRPDCPSTHPNECISFTVNYAAEKISGNVNLASSYDGISLRLTVTATTSSTEFDSNHTEPIDLEDFSNLVAPSAGSHNLTVELVQGGNVITEDKVAFGTCVDNDGDGFCESEDCNDNSAAINSDAAETCDYIDNNCDGQIDEAFWQTGRKVGTSCGGAGICGGIWLCNNDGSDVVCNNTVNEGEQIELCGNNIDDDCDGVEDETIECSRYDVNNNCIESKQACFCEEGKVETCSTPQGQCGLAIQICVDGVFGECVSDRIAQPEVCNQLDDDCDGIFDNIHGGTSSQSTQCGCYNGATPSKEICNDIDDDCDGRVDEGLTCCTSGDTRACGTDTGICVEGMETCVNGVWNGLCAGEVKPVTEICFNNRDDSCNGQVDESCPDPEILCNNQELDLSIGEENIDCGGLCKECEPRFLWLALIIAGVVILVVLVILIGHLKSQGKELTWSELSSRWSSFY